MNGERLNILEERVAELEMELEKCKAEIEASRGPSPGLLVSSEAQYHNINKIQFAKILISNSLKPHGQSLKFSHC